MSSRCRVRLTAMPTTPLADALARHVGPDDVPGLVAVVGRGDDLDVTVLGDQTVGGPPMREDSLHRIASIGKPITAAAALALVADGVVALTDPVDDLLPELAAPRVVRTLTSPLDDTVAADRPITVEDLLRSTNGHGFPSDFSAPAAVALMERLLQGPPQPQRVAPPDEWMATLGAIPLLHQPGDGFTYNAAFDILGVLIARASGRSFPEYLTARILRPLGMDETRWWVDEPDLDRLATLYMRGPDGTLVPNTALGEEVTRPPLLHAGGGGLVSTVGDYHRFTQMLLRGGELDGVRLLGPRTVAYMTRNHLPGGADMETMGRPIFAESSYRGVGFGLGFSVVDDAAAGKLVTSAGEYAWGGMASTAFYVDPVEEVTAMFFTQFLPSSTYPIRPRLRALVAQALVD